MNNTKIDKRTTRKTQSISAPGPHGHPLFGSMAAFRKDRLGFIKQMALEYGEVVKYRLANLTFYQVNHPDGIQQILQGNHHNYLKGPSFDPIRTVSGNGLFTSEGSFWLRQRRLMQPSFHRKQVASFVDLMTIATENMLTRWEEPVSNGESIKMMAEMSHLKKQPL